jgi:hypothetical protein
LAPLYLQDMESEDYEFYKGLDFLLEHKVTDLGYDLTFSTEIQEFGVTEIRDLISDGRNITVSIHLPCCLFLDRRWRLAHLILIIHY